MGELELEPPPPEIVQAQSPRWPAEVALLTAWLQPAATAQRTQHVSLNRAFAVHLIASGFATVLVLYLIAWSDAAYNRAFSHVFFTLIEAMNHEWHRDPEEFLLVVLGTVLGIEFGFLALAFLMMAWGARVEPLRVSYAHALRRVWLQTGHALLPIVLVGVLAIIHDTAHRNWWAQPAPMIPPPAHPGPSATAQELADHSKARQEFLNQQQDFWSKLNQQQPWYIRYGLVFPFLAGFLSAAWIIWALLRSVGAARNAPQLVPSPSCDFCGYNLTTATMESRCPECGEPVIESLGPDVRPGSDWQQHYRDDWKTGYSQSCVNAVVEPAKLGRQIRLFSPGTEHRVWVVWHLLAIFCISVVGFPLVLIAANGIGLVQREPEILLFVTPAIAFFTALMALTLTLFSAGLLGIILSKQLGRNLMPATMQIASYLTGFLTIGVFFAWLTGALLSPVSTWSRNLQTAWRMDDEFIRFIFWSALNLIWLAIYCAKLWRGASAAAYANR